MGVNPYLGLLLVVVLALIFGFIIYMASLHRVIQAGYLYTLLATFAVNMIIIGIGTTVFSTSPRNVDFSLGSIDLGPIILQGTRLLAAGASIVMTAALYLFLYFTRPGKAIRAVSDNRAAAELMGIPSSQVLALSFGLGTMLAAVAGGLTSTFFPFTILSGSTYQLKSFVICVLGGLGTSPGGPLRRADPGRSGGHSSHLYAGQLGAGGGIRPLCPGTGSPAHRTHGSQITCPSGGNRAFG